MIEELKSLIESVTYEVTPAVPATDDVPAKEAVLAPLYPVEYEESNMMNVRADDYSRGKKFAYIEEFLQGKYVKEKYFSKKVVQVQIYFCQFSDVDTTAVTREEIRAEIERDIVVPFMSKYNASGDFEKVNEWRFTQPLPRFDAGEISIMLQFDCKQTKC